MMKFWGEYLFKLRFIFVIHSSVLVVCGMFMGEVEMPYT